MATTLLKVLLTVLWLVTVSYQQESASSSTSSSGSGSGILQEINILLLLSFEVEGPTSRQPWHTDGPVLVPAAELAVEQINQREDILAGYVVKLTVANSACNLQEQTVVNFVKSFFDSGVRFAGIVGPACSDAVELVSSITGKDGISILNFHTANSPRFTDRSKYRYSFGTAGSAHALVTLFLYLMKEKEWESVAVLYEEEKFVYLTSYNVLIRELPHIYPKGKIVFSAPISHLSLPLSSIINHHIRVVLIMGSSEIAHKIICLIWWNYRQIKFPAYQFVFAGAYVGYPTSFTLNNHHYKCSSEEMIQIVQGSLIYHLELHNTMSSRMISELTYEEYFKLYSERINGKPTEWANPLYDGVWSLALGLNNSIPKLNDIRLDVADYMYGHQEATNIIRDEVVQLSFEGASGHIHYSNTTGYSPVTVNIYQVHNNTSIFLVGIYTEYEHRLLLAEDAQFVESSFKTVYLVANPGLVALFVFIAVVALVLVISAQILTLTYNKFHTIRASSYRLGQLAYLGCYIITLCFVSITTGRVAHPTSAEICTLTAWTLPLGLTLILGTVALKTWRLYQIFFLLKKPGKFLHDGVLIVVVLLLVAIELIVFATWTANFSITILFRGEVFTDKNTIEVKAMCYSKDYYILHITLALHIGLIAAFALVLVLLTRKIRHESFKTKSVALLVYSLAITLGLGVPLFIILRRTQRGMNLEYAAIATTLIVVLFSCFFFLFFPPLLPLLRVKFFHKIPGLRRYSQKVAIKPYKLSSYT